MGGIPDQRWKSLARRRTTGVSPGGAVWPGGGALDQSEGGPARGGRCDLERGHNENDESIKAFSDQGLLMEYARVVLAALANARWNVPAMASV